MIEIKGSAVGDAIKSVRSRSGDQVYATIVSQLKGDARTLFDPSTRILPSEWYPLDSFVQFLEADIKITANGNEEELVKRSEVVVEKQLSGIYRLFVRMGSPSFLLNRISIIQEAYFRGIDVEVKMTSPSEASMKYTGFTKQHRLMGFTLIGFYRKAMELSGAKDVRTAFLTSIEEGKGYCELLLTWSGK